MGGGTNGSDRGRIVVESTSSIRLDAGSERSEDLSSAPEISALLSDGNSHLNANATATHTG